MSKRSSLLVAGGIALLAVLVLAGCGANAGSPAQVLSSSEAPTATESSQPQAAQQATPAAAAPASKPAKPAGLQIKDEVVGKGAAAKSGDSVTVDYTGWLTNGTKFDSSKDRNQPFTFTLDAGQVIPGWDQGVAGMKVGGKRKLTIPPELGYGAQGAGGGVIPPNATLVFEVDLLKIN